MGSVERVSTGSAPLDRPVRRDAAIDVFSADEKRCAEAFRFEQERQRFIACRSARVLGRCLGRRPSDVGFRNGPKRTPRLTDLIELPEASCIDTRIGVGHG